MEIINQDWYKLLIEDCRSIITEAVFTSRWTLIEGYHNLGKRILAENDNFERSKIYGKEITKRVSQSLGKSVRMVEKSVQFARSFETLDTLPDGKNITVRKIFNEILPEPKIKPIPLPEGQFRVIYADPPWKYSNSGFETSAESHYRTMATEEICAMPMVEKSAEDSVLLLWVTNPMLEDGLTVVSAWGFEYKTNFVWTKNSHIAGFHNFGQHELLLVCTKGSMLPKKLLPSILNYKVQDHSRKPLEMYDLIEQMYDAPYLELFARTPQEGWSSWGDEL